MDVVDELKSISLEKHLAKLACKELSEDAAKKAHLFKVLEFSYFLEELVVDKALEKLDLRKLLIFPTDNSIEPITFYIHSSAEKIIFLEAHTAAPEIINDFQKLLNDISKTSRLEYTSGLNISKAIEIELIEGAGEKAVEYLLSDELKAILEYSQMQLELDVDEITEEHSEKKLKI
jgi:hypothetical protein